MVVLKLKESLQSLNQIVQWIMEKVFYTTTSKDQSIKSLEYLHFENTVEVCK